MCEVIVLFEGFSRKLERDVMEANCSCVLIKGPKKIIVDTMTAWDKEKIVEALATNDVKPDEIDFVVCTHSHADHIGNNNLFTNAEHIVGFTVHKGPIFQDKNLQEGEYQLCTGVKVLPTPGHTHEDVTVLVDGSIEGNPGTIAITGDLFEKLEDVKNPVIWESLGMPELRKTQAENRFLVIMLADYIVPGHGKMFRVTEDIRGLLETQVPVDLNASNYSWKNMTT